MLALAPLIFKLTNISVWRAQGFFQLNQDEKGKVLVTGTRQLVSLHFYKLLMLSESFWILALKLNIAKI